MIEFALSEHGVKVMAHCTYPTIYLDHWAWMMFAENPDLARRLATALKSRGGTLAISWLNLVEFCRADDPRHGPEADALLNSILPNIFVLDSDFWRVIDREDHSTPSTTLPPHGDFELFHFFVGTNFAAPASLRLLTAHDFCKLAQATGLKKRSDDMADFIVALLEGKRQEYLEDRHFRGVVKREPKHIDVQRGTRVIAQELLGSLLKDITMRIRRSDAIDTGHAVVPVAYCDLVLLDRAWCSRVEQAKKRIRAAGMTFPLADVFSAARIGAFMAALES